MISSLIVIDDFYAEPLAVRQKALELDYPTPEERPNYPGCNSRQLLLMPGLDELISEVTGEKLRGSPNNAHGRCRLSYAADDAHRQYYVHIDPGVIWSGIVYLSLPEHCQGGTEFFRHLETNGDRTPLYPHELQAAGARSYWEAGDRVIQRDSNDLSRWELTSTVPMRFNRLVLLRPWFYHTAGPSFGDSPENCRLVHLFFFESAA